MCLPNNIIVCNIAYSALQMFCPKSRKRAFFFFFVKCEWGKLACAMPIMIKGYVLGEMERE